MKKKYTHLAVVVDRSGSMAIDGLNVEAEAALRQFLKEQANEPGKLTLTLTQFDDRFDIVTDTAKPPFTELDGWTLAPRGMTALLDAIGKTTTATIEMIDGLKKKRRPENVIVVIVTDGGENSSKDWTSESVKKLVEARTADGWQFVFLAADQDAVLTGKSFGITNAANFDNTGDQYHQTYAMVSRSVSAFRGGSTKGVEVTDVN